MSKRKVKRFLKSFCVFHSKRLAGEVKEQAAEKVDQAKEAASELATAVQVKGETIFLSCTRFFIFNV